MILSRILYEINITITEETLYFVGHFQNRNFLIMIL